MWGLHCTSIEFYCQFFLFLIPLLNFIVIFFKFLLHMLIASVFFLFYRHGNVSLELLLKLVAVFGPVVRSAISARPSVGVDLHAEER